MNSKISNKIITATAIFLLFIFAGCSTPPSKTQQKTKTINLQKADGSQKTPQLNEKETELLYQKGKDAQKAHDIEEATLIYKKILKDQPHHYRARKRLGEVYYMIGEYEPAIREFKQVLKDNPPNPGAAKSNLVLCYLAVDRPENALKYISPEIDQYSRWGTHYSFMIQALYSQYMLAKSKDEKDKLMGKIKKQLKKGINETEDKFPRSMLKAGLALFDGNKKEVKTNLEKALLSDSSGRDRVSILFLIGALEADSGNNSEAIKNFKQVLDFMDKSQLLEFQNFMDGFYSLWALEVYGKDYKLKFKDIQNLVERIPGGIREPEMQEFIAHIKDYIEAKDAGNNKKALESLEEIENCIKDESIEGDYFYDGIYKPFILKMLNKSIKECKN